MAVALNLLKKKKRKLNEQMKSTINISRQKLCQKCNEMKSSQQMALDLKTQVHKVIVPTNVIIKKEDKYLMIRRAMDKKFAPVRPS